MFIAEFCIVILAMILGARYGGIFFGMAGGVGLMALILIFGLAPASPPIAVMLIMMSVVLAASTLQSAGGMAFLVRIAEKLLRKQPKAITFVAPLIAWLFIICQNNFRHSFSLTWSGKTCDIRRSL